MAGRLAGKVAIVTGAGRGIGEATARAFATEGAKVVVAELDPATGAATAQAIGGTFVACDVTRTDQVQAAVEATLAAHGRIDVLVANAGVNVFHEPLEMPESEWRRCFAVDLEGVWHCCRAVLPAMLAQGGGSIVAIASCHSFAIIPHTFPYPVAKHALLGLVRSLGIEYAAQGVRVNAIAPGYIETQIALDYWSSFPDPEAERRKACDLHPPRRIGRPEEVAMTALFLASDEAPFINASCITIDGGRSVLYHD